MSAGKVYLSEPRVDLSKGSGQFVSPPPKVDVLAVMDSAIRFATVPVERDALTAARAAVAELIEADREYDDALRLANIGYGSDQEDRAAHERLREAFSLRRAALARIGGAA